MFQICQYFSLGFGDAMDAVIGVIARYKDVTTNVRKSPENYYREANSVQLTAYSLQITSYHWRSH